MHWKLWVGLALVGVLGIFVLQNTQVVEVKLLVWRVEMSRALLLLGIFVAGLGLGWLLGTLRRHP